jgi:hypothetical protein
VRRVRQAVQPPRGPRHPRQEVSHAAGEHFFVQMYQRVISNWGQYSNHELQRQRCKNNCPKKLPCVCLKEIMFLLVKNTLADLGATIAVL